MSEFWLTAAKAAIVVALGSLAVFAGGRVVLWIFGLAERRQAIATPPPATATPPTSVPATTDSAEARGGVAVEPAGEGPAPPIAAAANVLRGGAWIGMLERLAIFATLIAGYPEGLAIALALKGLARYPELKATTSGAAERFIIGTFTSVLVAAAAAGLARWLVTLF